MKNTILILSFLLTTSFSLAQGKTTTKISHELQKKIQSTPVGFIKNGKIQINQEALNPKICSGEKITSFKIKKHTNVVYLIRRAQLKKGYFSSFILLKRIGDKLFVNQYAGNFVVGCYSTSCNSCAEAVSGTGSVFCECPGGDGSSAGDCTEYDHCPDEVTLSALFL